LLRGFDFNVKSHNTFTFVTEIYIMRKVLSKENYFYTTEEADFIRLFEMKTMLESITVVFIA